MTEEDLGISNKISNKLCSTRWPIF